MFRIRFFICIALLLPAANTLAQKAELIKNYISQYKDIAIEEMKRTGVPAAITLAQGIHESGIGQSKLAVMANNHFGIKCKSNWTGPTITHTDDARNECFRKYASALESYKDHSDFLKNGQRYASLFLLQPTDYVGWANGLKQAGYATNPKYAPTLIKLIEENNLQVYTNEALGIYQDTDKTKDVKTAESIISTENTMKAPVYPSGEFKINETKVILLKKGSSFLSVAQQYNIELYKLFEINDMEPMEMNDRDQLIYLQRKRTKGKNDFHIVQVGETLHDIAQAEAIRLKSLMELNWLETGMEPAPGEKLSLKEKSKSIPKLTLKDNYSINTHTVSKTVN